MVMKRFTALLYGWITIFALMLLSSFILALVIRYTEIGNSTLNWLTLGLGLIYLFAGGLLSGMKGKEKGWLLGTITGLGYSIFILLYQFLAYDQLFSGSQWIYHALFLAAALLGGISGVNMQGNRD
ncbi:TIGR04086 family membrane protein [Salinibacillus xinjiangensis]|uniref:TIGR04086 family membrane protein n=1 Tax=Salinibacillus xinjiangensis TaxID=1229268 RepID=A0A6G1XBF5_9BACI|nr:TIGR04086 family membrane protein [Salinibacillus xinjiangensis]MRG88249.1 TIGR04086 family membrane protein [Salinibacillus xinjiangensis]